MAKNHYNLAPQTPALIQSPSYEGGAEALVLELRSDGHRCQGQCRYRALLRFYDYRAEQNMSDDLLVFDCHQG